MTAILFFSLLALCFLGPGIHLNVQQWRQRKREDFEYWLTCDPERHADNVLLGEAMETQFTNTGMTKTKMELLGASVWRVKA